MCQKKLCHLGKPVMILSLIYNPSLPKLAENLDSLDRQSVVPWWFSRGHDHDPQDGLSSFYIAMICSEMAINGITLHYIYHDKPTKYAGSISNGIIPVLGISPLKNRHFVGDFPAMFDDPGKARKNIPSDVVKCGWCLFATNPHMYIYIYTYHFVPFIYLYIISIFH